MNNSILVKNFSSLDAVHEEPEKQASINPYIFYISMSFQQFFTLVKKAIEVKGVTLHDAYKKCPSIVQERFPLQLAIKKYKDFLAGEVIEGDIFPEVSAPVLCALYGIEFGSRAENKVEQNALPMTENSQQDNEVNSNSASLNKKSPTIYAVKQSIPLADLFNFISDFKRKTGFGLPEIYDWLDPEIIEPEEGKEGYPWVQASEEYRRFKPKSRFGGKRISADIADAFFSVCENFKIYGGKEAKHVLAKIQRPVVEKKVFAKDLREFVQMEKERTHISDSIIWKIMPSDISARFSYYTYADAIKDNGEANRMIAGELAQCIANIYAQIPGRDQKVDVQEGLTVPPFGSKHCFSVSIEVASHQLNQQIEIAKAKKLYKTKKEFLDDASTLLQVNIEKIFDTSSRKVVPRLRVAICLALLEGHEIPDNVLEVHENLSKSNSYFKSLNKETPVMGDLVHG